MSVLLNQIARDGFTVIRDAFSIADIEQVATDLSRALQADGLEATSVRSSKGAVYASRNVLDVWPRTRHVWKRAVLVDVLTGILGPEFGLVRALYFDKPPDRTWSLGWHKDLTIAVEDHSFASERFSHRTFKAGVPHVQAPAELLEAMLTLRIHLDDVTDENGPLQVIPGSHRSGKDALANPPAPLAIYAHRGDVLAMRPLISHSSGNSSLGTKRHRRILHLEFAASPDLPDGFQWHTFVAARSK